jgi:hypothetical protein
MNFPAVVTHCIISQVGIDEFSPGEGLYFDVDLIVCNTQPYEVLTSSFETTDSPFVPQAVRERDDTQVG